LFLVNILVQVLLHVLDVPVEHLQQAMDQMFVQLALLVSSVLQKQLKIAPHAGQKHQSHAHPCRPENAPPIATACNSEKVQPRALAFICAGMELVAHWHQLQSLSALSQILLSSRRFHVITNPLFCAPSVSSQLRA
jgi:hypothetical protein